MDSEVNTVTLRGMASQWTLKGDDVLRNILENTHKKIITKCQEVEDQLRRMESGLDNVNIDLQNNNNKFMALSNSQFIESRVYEDDTEDTTVLQANKEPALPIQSESEQEMIKNSISVFERMHEAVVILDSDESDSEDEIDRIVLKPKDQYEDRPLPYIIGSQAWKDKWHAGLVVEDSDSDSLPWKPDVEEYSDSEPEPDAGAEVNDVPPSPDAIYGSSPEEAEGGSPETVQSPADVAAELARRLGGHPPPEVEEVPYTPPVPAVKQYKPQLPSQGLVFPEEPPPLSSSSSEGDIFAELHKGKAVAQPAPNDLFHFGNQDKGDIFSDFGTQLQQDAPQTSSLFEDETNLFTSQPQTEPQATTEVVPPVLKKPVGGISLFGTNIGAASIGAAILKRNQRKSSSSDDNDDIKRSSSSHTEQKNTNITEKDIFENLFGKSSKTEKEKVANLVKNEQDTPKIDLFSDNLFDDIDDIFTTKVKVLPEDNMEPKSLLDEEDDDLFAAVADSKMQEKASRNVSKVIDSSDELFTAGSKDVDSENFKTSVYANNSIENLSVNKSAFNNNKPEDSLKTIGSNFSPVHIESIQKPKLVKESIFDSDSESDIFDNFSKPNKLSLISNKSKDDMVPKVNNESQSDLTKHNYKEPNESKAVLVNTKSINESKLVENFDNKKNLKENISTLKSPSLFDDDDESELFTNSKAIETKTQTNSDIKEKHISSQCTSRDIEERAFDDSNKVNISIDVNYSEKMVGVGAVNADSALPDSNKNYSVNQDVANMYTHTFGSPDGNLLKHNMENNTRFDAPVIGNKNIASDMLKETPIDNNLNNEVSKDNKINDLSEKNIFDSILNEPPVFEKPKEPKKSKNINALFDDDSDDEALFFKKSDILDEPSSEFLNEDRFGIFQDEPPAIEVDFEPHNNANHSKNQIHKEDNKPSSMSQTKLEENANNNIFDEIDKAVMDSDELNFNQKSDTSAAENSSNLNKILVDSDEELFNSPPKFGSNMKDSPEVLFKSTVHDEISHNNTNNESNEQKNAKLTTQPKVVSVERTQPTLQEIEKATTQITKDNNDNAPKKEIKKIGKLKSFNLNINVNALLPGASPKKQKLSSPVKDITEDIKVSPKLVKSKSLEEETTTNQPLSFDQSVSSEVLDNTFSKERPKIQVKRRPSTRRARKEAVRKSAIDFSEDSTDNSSSFDDAKDTNNTAAEVKSDKFEDQISDIKITESERVEQIDLPTGQEIDLNRGIKNHDKNYQTVDANITESKTEQTHHSPEQNIEHPESLEPSPKIKSNESDNILTFANVDADIMNKDVDPTSVIRSEVTKSNTITKVVYVLNDEDIFNTKPVSDENKKELFEDDDNYLFKPNINFSEVSGVKTLGQVYTDIKETMDEISKQKQIEASRYDSKKECGEGNVFDEERANLTDKNKVEQLQSSSSIFGQESQISVDKEKESSLLENDKFAKEKKSLFDIDNEDEIFNPKDKRDNKNIFDSDGDDEFFTKKKTERKEVIVKKSLFDDDEDDEGLFGASSNKIEIKPRTNQTSKAASKLAEPVFDDPLSLLSEDD